VNTADLDLNMTMTNAQGFNMTSVSVIFHNLTFYCHLISFVGQSALPWMDQTMGMSIRSHIPVWVTQVDFPSWGDGPGAC
jgi:ribulose-5-phosphate 4-epimerase/fuculose-1-phosphate aldolase